MYSFSYLVPVCCSMSSSNCCFLTLQVSQEADQVVWYAHHFQNLPQFVVIHTVKGLSIVNEAEVDVVFWNSLAFSMFQHILAIWSLPPLPFLNPACTSESSWFTYCWNLAWRILSIILLACDECNTLTASSFKIWNSSPRIPSAPLALFVVMLP